MLHTPAKNELNSKISHFFWQLAQTFYICNPKGRLAQLVQSTCLTSRGSLVRTQYLPPKSPSEKFEGFLISYYRPKSSCTRTISASSLRPTIYKQMRLNFSYKQPQLTRTTLLKLLGTIPQILG